MSNYQPTSNVWRHGFSTGLNINSQFKNSGKWQIPIVMYPAVNGEGFETGMQPIEFALYQVNVQFLGYSEYKPNS